MKTETLNLNHNNNINFNKKDNQKSHRSQQDNNINNNNINNNNSYINNNNPNNQSFHYSKFHKCGGETNPLDFDLLDYLKEAQNNEFNDFNTFEHPNPDDFNFQITNKVKEMLVLSNLFIFKGTNVYQQVLNMEKDLLVHKSTILKQEKDLENKKEMEHNYNKLESKYNLSEEQNNENKMKIVEQEGEIKNKIKIINGQQQNIDSFTEEAKKYINMDELVKSNIEQDLKIKSINKLLKGYEDSQKHSNEQSKVITKFIEQLQDELKQAKDSLAEKERVSKEEIIKIEIKLFEKDNILRLNNKEKDNIRNQLLDEIKLLKKEKEKDDIEKEKLINAKYSLNNELNNLKAANNEKEISLSSLKGKTMQIKSLEDKLNNKDLEITTLESENNKNKHKIHSLEENITTLNKMIEGLTKEIQKKSTSNELNFITSEMKKNKKDYEANVDTLNTLTNLDSSIQMNQIKESKDDFIIKRGKSNSNLSPVKEIKQVSPTMKRSKSTLVFNESNNFQTDSDFTDQEGNMKKSKTITSVLMNSNNDTPNIPTNSSNSTSKNRKSIEVRKSVTFVKNAIDTTFSNSRKTFTNKSDSFETLCLKSNLTGNYKCTFKIIKMSYGIHLGICTKKIELSDINNREFLGKQQQEYALNLFSGYLWKDDKKYQKLDKVFSNGDLVEMIIENGSLSFKWGNNVYQAFKGISDSFYPAVTLMKKDDSIQLISIEMI